MGTGNTRSFVTDKGRALDLKLIATASALHLTKAQLGDGELPAGGSPYDRAGLVNYVMDASIEYVSPPASQQVQVVIQAMPTAVAAVFIVKEAALFALDPDEGEILYAYVSMADDPVELKPISNGVGRILSVEVNVLVSNVAEVTAEINPSANTKLLGMIQAHTTDHANPHGVTAEQVGARPSTWMPNAAQVRAFPFNVVITTQAEFEALIASPTWLGAVSVCFVGDGGTLKFTRSDGKGCKIPQTVKQIQGVNSATIEVTNFSYNATTSRAAFWYETRPTDSDYWIDGLIINCTGAISSDGFYKCAQISNCACSSTSTGASSAYAFNDCAKLISCIGTGTVINSTNYGIGFNKCSQLTFCIGIGEDFANSGARGFSGCTQLTSCIGTSNKGVGFSNCTELINCTGTGNGINTSGFFMCTQLTNCTGTGICDSNSLGCGFYNCAQLANCKGNGTGKNGYGFNGCTQLTNCIGTGVGISNGSGYSFYSCNYLNGCKQGDTASTTGFLGGTNTKVDNATVVAS